MKKVLVCGDSSLAESGFAQYNRAILNRLHSHPDFEVAELAFSGQVEQMGQTPWKFYPVAVSGDHPRFKEFMSNVQNRYGKWRFDQIVLHFRPDIVLSLSDPWQVVYQSTAPTRPYFNWVLCPTVDSDPQKPEFLQSFHQADLLCTYTEYGKKILEDKGLKVDYAIPMGIDENVFKPLDDKVTHKKRFGLPEDSIIFGFVFRNQARKRYTDLLEAFRKYLTLVDEATAKRSYLYFSTSNPDQGPDMSTMLLEYGLWNKVFFSYTCHKTGQWFPSLYQDSVTYSPFASAKCAYLPNVMKGVTQQQLVEVYNCMDIYIQWASNEGFGSPMIEAAACGLQVIAVDCSAMSEVAPNVNGEVVSPKAMPVDPMIWAKRAVMDNDALAERMKWYAENHKPDPMRYRQRVLDQYTWKHSLDKWVYALQNLDSKNNWNAPPHYIKVPEEMPTNVSVSRFVNDMHQDFHYRWLYHTLAMIKLLNHGFQLNGVQMTPVTADMIHKMSKDLAALWNSCEDVRIGKKRLQQEDYLA